MNIFPNMFPSRCDGFSYSSEKDSSAWSVGCVSILNTHSLESKYARFQKVRRFFQGQVDGGVVSYSSNLMLLFRGKIENKTTRNNLNGSKLRKSYQHLVGSE